MEVSSATQVAEAEIDDKAKEQTHQETTFAENERETGTTGRDTETRPVPISARLPRRHMDKGDR